MKRLVQLSILAGVGALGIFAAVTYFAAAPDDIPGPTVPVDPVPTDSLMLKPSKLAGYAVAQQKCAICHSADYIAYQPPGMNQAQWTAEMAKMQHSYGAPISDNEIKLLGVYLAATYGDGKDISAADLAAIVTPTTTMDAPAAVRRGSSAAPADASAGAMDVQALLTDNACLGCHAVDQKIVGPAYHEVAAKYHADPNAITKLQASIKAGGVGKWGQVPMPAFAQLTDDEVRALATFVMQQ
ncbi:c-type cytochrome [Thermomonas sp.]